MGLRRLLVLICLMAIIFSGVSPSLFSAAAAESDGENTDTATSIHEGMSLEEVRKRLGMPRNISRTEWRYPDRILLIEKQQVACVILPSCFGKWPNCSSYRSRAPECLMP